MSEDKTQEEINEENRKKIDEDPSVIHCELNKAVEEAETDEEASENIQKELSKLAPLAGENWRDAFK